MYILFEEFIFKDSKIFGIFNVNCQVEMDSPIFIVRANGFNMAFMLG